jgi:mannosyltransferase
MKIVYDDIAYSLQDSGGISLYWSQLETHLKHDMQLLYRNYENNIFYSESSVTKRKKINIILFERYKNVSLPERTPFIFHSSYYRYCKNKNAINITTVHDFIYEYFRHDIKAMAHKIQKRNAIHHSHGIIFVSESTKNDFEKLFPDYKGTKSVIYHGIASEYMSLNTLKKKKVIFIGKRAGYKNFIYAVKILNKLPQFKLQVIGGGSLTKKEICELDSYLPNRYEYYQSLPNRELNIKYNEACFLIYPSLYEGFGFPVVEAQAAGCPVVCCNNTSLPEVGGDAAMYISGRNIDDDLDKINRLNERVYYKTLVDKGFENCKRFSWIKCANETFDFYKKVFDLCVND